MTHCEFHSSYPCFLRLRQTFECVFFHKWLIYYRTWSSCSFSWGRVKSFSMISKGSTCEAIFTAQSPVTSCSTKTYKRSSYLFLEVHLLPSDRTQASIIIAWKCWWNMAANCMWASSSKLLSTQAISIVEQPAHMKRHWLFCNIIDAVWQPLWSRGLQSRLSTLTVRLSVCQSGAAVI